MLFPIGFHLVGAFRSVACGEKSRQIFLTAESPIGAHALEPFPCGGAEPSAERQAFQPCLPKEAGLIVVGDHQLNSCHALIPRE
ncbi:MAG: hypothetical protein F4Y55_12895 [Gammaproteobacteria bacterium]|nr:hypothetical protein [Gammaproteobacteria bacterium]